MSASYYLNLEDQHPTTAHARTPLVLIHAFPVGPRIWDDLRPNLLGRTLIVHLPGFGTSPLPPGPANLDDGADGLAAALDRAGIDRVAVAGVSLGGYAALSFLERHGDRVSGLGLLDTHMRADPAAKREDRAKQAAEVRERGTAALSIEGLLSETTLAKRPETVQRVEKLVREANPAGVIWALEAMATRPDRTHVAAEAQIPILVLAGEEDAMTPLSVMREPLADLENVWATTVSGAGHLAAMEKPREVAQALNELVERAS